MSVVLVTGSSGFIGSYLVRELDSAGHQVIGLDVQAPGPAGRFVQGAAWGRTPLEIGSVEQWSTIVAALQRHSPKVIVHTASFVRPDVLAREPLTALRANVESTLQVFEAARLMGVQRVVYLSSIGVLPAARYLPIDADHPVITAREGTPDTFYGAAKIACEAFAFAYLHGMGLDMLIVRPSAVYGFGMNWPIYVKPMVENSLRGEPTHFATGAAMPRDYTHALDVAQLVRRCVEISSGDVVDRVFYGATGRDPVTAGQVASIVAELVPGANIQIGPGLAEDEVRDAATRGRFDLTAAREQLGYEPRFADVRDGIAQYIEMYHEFELQA